MVDIYEGRKASWRRPPGRPLNVWLNKIQEDINALLLSTLWRSEIAMGHGAAQRSLGIRDDDDGDDDDHGRRHGGSRVGKRPPWKKSGWAWPTLEILAVV